MALAQDNLDAFGVCYTKAVDRLHHVCELANTLQPTDCGSLSLSATTIRRTHTMRCPHPGYKSNCFDYYNTMLLLVSSYL